MWRQFHKWLWLLLYLYPGQALFMRPVQRSPDLGHSRRSITWSIQTFTAGQPSLPSPSQRWLRCSTGTAIFTIWETYYYRWLFKHNFSIFSKVYDKASIKIFVNHPNVRLIRFVKVLGLFGKELAVLKAKALFPDNISVEIQDPHSWLIGFIIQWYTAWRLMALISRAAAGPRGDNCSEQLHSTPPESSTDGLQPYLL